MIENPGHVAVAENLIQQLERGKTPSLAKAAKDAGYSYGGATSTLKDAMTFQRALWEAMPFSLLAKIQQRQLGAVRRETVTWPIEFTEDKIKAVCALHEWIVVVTYEEDKRLKSMILTPHYEQIDKALDKVYKLAGFYAAEKVEHQVTRPLEEMTDEELDKMIGQHITKAPVNYDQSIPNVVTGEVQANIIDVEPS